MLMIDDCFLVDGIEGERERKSQSPTWDTARYIHEEEKNGMQSMFQTINFSIVHVSEAA